MKRLSVDFAEAAALSLPETPFCTFLQAKFGQDSALQTAAAFARMGLDMPVSADEFVIGTEGCLVPLDRYGIMLRIENADVTADGVLAADRIDDSGWILQPVAAIKAGRALIELSPGCRLDLQQDSIFFLHDKLYAEQIDYWD